MTPDDARQLKSAVAYIQAQRKTKWAKEIAPWTKQIEKVIE